MQKQANERAGKEKSSTDMEEKKGKRNGGRTEERGRPERTEKGGG